MTTKSSEKKNGRNSKVTYLVSILTVLVSASMIAALSTAEQVSAVTSQTHLVKYWSWGWHWKYVTNYYYHFKELKRWGWGPYIRYAGCEDDHNWYAWSEAGFELGTATLYDMTKTTESLMQAEKGC